MLVGAARRVPLVGRTAVELVANPDPFDHQYATLDFDVAFGFRRQAALTSLDLARLQRATQGSGQSTGGGGDDIVEGGGLRLVGPGGRLVMLGHLVMHPKENGLAPRW